MGTKRHHAIIVTAWDRERAAKAHSYAMALFGPTEVTPILVSNPNAISTFFVGPDGSQEGWDESDIGDQRRGQLIEWLDRDRGSDDGDSYYDWAMVQYGDESRLVVDPPEDCGTRAVAHSDERWRADAFVGHSARGIEDTGVANGSEPQAVTEEQLAEWERVEKAATAGPWTWWTSCSFRRLSSDATGKDGDVLAGDIQRSDGHPDVLCSDGDRAFIAAARTAVPALLAEVRRLRAEIDDMKSRALEAAEAADRDE